MLQANTMSCMAPQHSIWNCKQICWSLILSHLLLRAMAARALLRLEWPAMLSYRNKVLLCCRRAQ